MKKKINWKLMNAAILLELILSYLLPFRVTDGFQYKVGFPAPFLTVYNKVVGVNPFSSMHLNPVALLLNIVLFYLVFAFVRKLISKFKKAPAGGLSQSKPPVERVV